MDGPLALILGGRDKMTSLAEMLTWIQRKAQHVVLLGEAAERFAQALSATGYNAFERVENMEQAVAAALAAVSPSGGAVLLSPACASFDQYSGYEARGEHFKELVAGLEL